MNRKGKKAKNKVNIKLILTAIIAIIFIICFVYNIIALFVNPTDTFMIENGEISSSEEAVRIYNKGRKTFSRRKL